MASTTIIRATSSFTFTSPAGVPICVREGETFHKESARLEGLSDEAREGSFVPFVPDHDLEQATAAPGEKRSTRRRKESKSDEENAAATDDGGAKASE